MSTYKNYMDTDAYRLPEGMKRVGYDADTERYTFRYGNQLWVGEPGSYYGGKMKFLRNLTKEEAKVPVPESSRTTRILEPPVKAPNDWGVHPVSISDTDAPPVDSDAGARPSRSNTLLRKAANSTITALRVARTWSAASDSKSQGLNQAQDFDDKSSLYSITEKRTLTEKH